MAVEAKRGCGYRKVGGLYLVSGPGGMPCDRLPIALDVCPVCNHGFKQSRGFTWVDVEKLVGGAHLVAPRYNHNDSHPEPTPCGCFDACPLCKNVADLGPAGMLWIGEKFYKTVDEFNRESAELGVSRRIKAIPRGFKVGETWILMAHPKTIQRTCEKCEGSGWLPPDGTEVGLETNEDNSSVFKACPDCGKTGRLYTPGVFKLWRPQRVEKILLESQRGSEEHAELEERGITCVFVPDDDPDHRGSVYDKEEGSGDDQAEI